jgi:hypothetical protein
MLRSIKTIARQHFLNEEELRKFLIKKNFNLIPFKEDFLAHPWTVKEIIDNFKSKKDKGK